VLVSCLIQGLSLYGKPVEQHGGVRLLSVFLVLLEELDGFHRFFVLSDCGKLPFTSSFIADTFYFWHLQIC
jgi:hypothetical protein